jgi:hypothetical protein
LENQFLKHKKMGSVIDKLLTPEETMEIHPVLHPVVALLAGVLILIFPAILNYIIAFYLIIIGIVGIVGAM